MIQDSSKKWKRATENTAQEDIDGNCTCREPGESVNQIIKGRLKDGKKSQSH
jgi:hypothetical protein